MPSKVSTYNALVLGQLLLPVDNRPAQQCIQHLQESMHPPQPSIAHQSHMPYYPQLRLHLKAWLGLHVLHYIANLSKQETIIISPFISVRSEIMTFASLHSDDRKK